MDPEKFLGPTGLPVLGAAQKTGTGVLGPRGKLRSPAPFPASEKAPKKRPPWELGAHQYPSDSYGGVFVAPTLQRRKRRLREVRQLA